MTKTEKQKKLNLMAGVFDCDYMISRLKGQGKLSEIEQWENYKQDLLKLIEKQGV